MPSDRFAELDTSASNLFDANNELFAIIELLETEDHQKLELSEWGRLGLAKILNRICTTIVEATGNLPLAADINSEIEALAMERAADIAVSRMNKTRKGAGHEQA